MNGGIKTMVVDDSSLFRKVIGRMFDGDESIRIVGEAVNGMDALEKINDINPDVLILDINMPVMDGLTTLKHIMIRHPRPTVMFSTLTKAGAKITFDSLKCGAVDFVQKPSRLQGFDLEEQRKDIIKKVTLAAGVETRNFRYLRTPARKLIAGKKKEINYIFAIGASEGGFGGLLKLLPQLSPGLPVAFIVVLHEETHHVKAFVNYLQSICQIDVKTAENDQPLESGTCYIASGSDYVTVEPSSGRYLLQVSPSPFPNRKGAINILMFSVSDAIRQNAVAVMLSGSGDDGVEGSLEITRRGGIVIVQDPATCLCKAAPEAALKNITGQSVIVSDMEMADKINACFYE
ncbi:MAG: chemotaxis protein CheB [Desulfosalsimonadaceae bacterium]|nr:chemotaxis protein CheB [Desulfosalsimonadaceae bacterium]